MAIEKKFTELVISNKGCVVVFAGSGSDEAHIEHIATSLDRYGVPYEVRIFSGHKQSEEVLGVIREYDSLDGELGYVAVAGGTDALSGIVSFMSRRVVITCPPDHLNSSGLTNPPGSSNAYIAKPENIGRFFAQMFSQINPFYRTVLKDEVEAKKNSLVGDDCRLRDKYAKKQGR